MLMKVAHRRTSQGRAGPVFLLLCLLPIWFLCASAGSAELSGREILLKLAQPREGLQDYVCTVTLSAHSPSVHIQETTATLYFKRPDKYHFDAKKGVGFFPKQAFSIDWVSKELEKKADLRIVESDRRRGMTLLRIRVKSLEKPDQGHIDLLVDGDHYLLKGVEVSAPSRGAPSMQMTHQLVAGKFWLPKKTIVKSPVPGRSEPATFTLTFSHYRTNVGLSDDLFVNKQGK